MCVNSVLLPWNVTVNTGIVWRQPLLQDMNYVDSNKASAGAEHSVIVDYKL